MLEITLTDGRGRPARAPGLAEWLRRVAPRSARGAVTIALVSDPHIRRLNRQYRRKDYATDVLSFPDTDDIVIAKGVARRQAREQGHSDAVELKILALHGLLHLLGYDHDRDDGEMRRVEERLRRKGGLRRGLIARARGSTASPRVKRGGHPAPVQGSRAKPAARPAPVRSSRAKPAARPAPGRGSRAKPAARPEPVEGRAQ